MVSHPEGKLRKLTNELNDYGELSVSADSKTIATSRTRRSAKIWACPLGSPREPRQLTTGLASEDAIWQLAPTTGGRIVVRTPQDGRQSLWVIDPDGSHPRRLTPENLAGWFPHVARSSGAIVFNGRRDDRIVHAWKIDENGENLVQLTEGTGEAAVAVSPDGGTVLYYRFDDPGLWKDSLPGGQPVKIAVKGSDTCEYSPDGKHILLSDTEEENGRFHGILDVIPAKGGAPTQRIKRPGSVRNTNHWAPSGDAVTYLREVDGVANVWIQPLAAGVPIALTHFTSGKIWEHAFSTDGNQLFVLRGQESSEVLLITNFR
jgi:Tol biopolymer transport system component